MKQNLFVEGCKHRFKHRTPCVLPFYDGRLGRTRRGASRFSHVHPADGGCSWYEGQNGIQSSDSYPRTGDDRGQIVLAKVQGGHGSNMIWEGRQYRHTDLYSARIWIETMYKYVLNYSPYCKHTANRHINVT